MGTRSVAVMEVSPSTFREIKRTLDEAGYPTGASRLELDGIELLEGDASHEDAQYLTDIENAFRTGHSKGRVDPDLEKAWGGYKSELESGRTRPWRKS